VNDRDCLLDYPTYLNKTAQSNFTNICVNWNQYYSKCANVGVNPEYDTISFDNILIAWVAIFQVWKQCYDDYDDVGDHNDDVEDDDDDCNIDTVCGYDDGGTVVVMMMVLVLTVAMMMML